jgi:hypothetical protein
MLHHSVIILAAELQTSANSSNKKPLRAKSRVLTGFNICNIILDVLLGSRLLVMVTKVMLGLLCDKVFARNRLLTDVALRRNCLKFESAILSKDLPRFTRSLVRSLWQTLLALALAKEGFGLVLADGLVAFSKTTTARSACVTFSSLLRQQI